MKQTVKAKVLAASTLNAWRWRDAVEAGPVDGVVKVIDAFLGW